MNFKILTILSLAAISSFALEFERVIVPGKSSLIGMGYDSEKQINTGECLLPTNIVKEGKNVANIDLSTRISEQELAKSLGMQAGFRTRSGVTTTEASAKFLKNSKSSSFSIASVYTGDYQFKDQIFSGPKLNDLGTSLLGNPERFKTTCGDYYARTMSYGAKIYFSIRIDFRTEESKQAFEAKFSMNSPMTKVTGGIQQSKNEFSKETKVTVQALQIGGDISKLSQIFTSEGGSTKGSYSYVQCSFGDLKQCEKVLENAIEYTTNVETGFPSQISKDENAALLKVTYADYQSAGIYLDTTPELEEAQRIAREKISTYFEQALEQYQTVFDYINNGIMRLSSKQRVYFTDLQVNLYDSLMLLSNYSKKCFDAPLSCPMIGDKIDDEIESKEIIIYDSKDLTVAPEVFVQYCDLALSPKAKKPYADLVKNIVNQIYQANKEKYYSVSGSQKFDDMDLCQITSDLLLETDELDISFDALIANSKKADLPFTFDQDDLFAFEDITPIQTLTEVREINLSGHDIVDISALSELINLRKLELAKNNIEDVSVLSKLKRLTSLGLSDNEIKSIAQLNRLSNLRRLDITNNLYEVECPFPNERICISVDYRNSNTLSFIDRYENPMRWLSSSAKLSNGNILITGGRFDQSSVIAEIYDSFLDEFIMLPAKLNKPRFGHQMTTLDDGNILITGGHGAIQSAELFIASEGQFINLQAMKHPHAEHEAIKLDDGMILLTGGRKATSSNYNGIESSSFAQLYDPLTREFQRVGSMRVPRVGHTMTKLSNGNILIIGGHDYQRSINTLEIYDVKRKQFKKLPFRLQIGRSYHATQMVSDDQIIVLGGLFEKGQATDHIEVIDLTKRKVTLLEERLKKKRAFMSSIKLSNDAILLIGGAEKNKVLTTPYEKFDTAIKTMEIFDPFLGFSQQVSRELFFDRIQSSVHKLEDGRVLIFGGRGEKSGRSSSLFEYTF